MIFMRAKFTQYKYPLLAILIHIMVSILRCSYAVYGPLRLQGDEAQFWAWSKHLDWSYYSKPPLIAYCNYITQQWFGHSELSVKINAILCGMLIGWITYLFTYKVYQSHLKAYWASMLVLVMPFYVEISFFYSTDSILLLFWLLSAYFYWQASTTNKWQYWLALGLCIGIGSLGKYAMLFFIVTLLLYLLSKERKQLSNPALYAALSLSFTIFIPVVIWNMNHQFIGYQHLEHLSGLHDTQYSPLKKIANVVRFIGGQLALVSPLFVGMYYKMFKKNWHQRITQYFFIPMFFIWIIFIIVSLIKKHEADINWTMFVYAGLPILLASYIVDYHKERVAKVLFAITFLLLSLVSTIPTWNSLFSKKVLPVKSDPTTCLVNWKNAANDVNEVYQKCSNPQKTFLFTDDYMLASELMFYLYPNNQIYFFNNGSRMCEYQLWKGVEQYDNKDYDAIFIDYSCIYDNPTAQLPMNIKSAFTRTDLHVRKIYYYRNEPYYQLDIYRLKEFKHLKPVPVSNY